MERSVQNVIGTWNELIPTTGNLSFDADNNIPAGAYDFESVLLHEMGHVLGLDHANLGSESGLSGSSRDYTRTEIGSDGSYNLNPGADGVIGSHDDVRGDDVNVNWFRRTDNNPFTTDASDVYDSSTYSVFSGDLPDGHLFSANGSRAVAALAGHANTESVMQQGIRTDEAQRTLTEDDVAGIRVGMSGLDGVQGTTDDYTINLSYAGLDSSADVLINFDNTVPFAATTGIGLLASSGHKQMYATGLHFNTSHNWFFNDEITQPPVPEPEPLLIGDTDGDGDVDTTDIITAYTNFTGPGAEDMTREQGDVDPHPDGDGDVDVSDIMLMFERFTGPNAPSDLSEPSSMLAAAQVADPIIPDLIYDAATGEVTLDPEGNVIQGYQLQTSTAGMLSANFLPALGGVVTATADELAEATLGPTGLSTVTSIGNVFPVGMNLVSLNSFLSTFTASVELGAPLVNFDLVVLNSPSVPEPSTYAMAISALLGLALLARRRR